MVSFLLPSILEARMLIALCLFSISPYVWWLLDIGRHALCSYCFSCNPIQTGRNV